jgi:uncharacterized protein YbjT (DUF2867 family)
VELAQCDVLGGETLEAAMLGVSAGYYLIHSMAGGARHAELDIRAARNFASAASRSGIEHIIYLGGLADPQANAGRHLRSRLETGDILRHGSVPVTELRAGVIVGPGSISFEMIRYLTEQLPIVLGPRWLHNRAQPVAIQDVLQYLLAALEMPACQGGIYEIGGEDVITYAESILAYARLRGLRRSLVPIPLMPVGPMAYLVGRLTPVPARVAGPLIDGMRSDSVVRNAAARLTFPHIQPIGYQMAMATAMENQHPSHVEPVWDEGANSPRVLKHEGFFIDRRSIVASGSPGQIYRSFTRLGGRRGWLYLNGLWRLRGYLDRLFGGPGMRGRRHPDILEEGEVVDFYRVEALEPGRMMRLRAELRVPGAGWMEWSVRVLDEKGSLLSQVAYFAPRGVSGFLYWYLLYPVHRLVLAGLIRAIARDARDLE